VDWKLDCDLRDDSFLPRQGLLPLDQLRLAPIGGIPRTQKQKQIPFWDDNKKSRGKATACLGWEVVWIEKQISPLRAARAGRNDVRKEVLILLILRSRVDFDGH
jgi:hypothetical protein